MKFSSKTSISRSDFRIIILDPAKLSDNAWITVINVKESVVELSEKLINADYDYQLQRIWELKHKYPNSVTVADRWWAWEFLAESDKKQVIEVRIKSTWTWDLNMLKWYYTISKWLMVWFADTLFRKKVLNIFDDLTDLIKQLWDFIEIKSMRSKIILYKWKWKTKDDLVLSLVNWTCYLYKVLWLHTTKEWKDMQINLIIILYIVILIKKIIMKSIIIQFINNNYTMNDWVWSLDKKEKIKKC